MALSGARADQAHGATFVELFFDLVFVFAVTQVAALVHDALSPLGILRAVLVFWLVWWAWEQFVWVLNAANADHLSIRLGTLLSAAVAFFMAVTVPEAFTAAGAWFAATYVVVKLVGLGLYLWVARDDPALLTAVRRFSFVSLAELSAVALGSGLPPQQRTVAFAVAVALDVFAAWHVRTDEWRLFPGHFAERHGLFVIIALGESLIAAGVASSEMPRTLASAAVAAAAVVVACALWWTYFGRTKSLLEEAFHQHVSTARGEYARDVYALGHFPIAAGVIGVAVAVEEAVAHPLEVLEPAFVMALIVGVALFVGGVALVLVRADRPLPTARLALIVVLIAAYPLLVTVSATLALTVVATLITLLCLSEQRPAVR